jgi:hypothetical protein
MFRFSYIVVPAENGHKIRNPWPLASSLPHQT